MRRENWIDDREMFTIPSLTSQKIANLKFRLDYVLKVAPYSFTIALVLRTKARRKTSVFFDIL